jgi:putative transposase
LGLNIKQAMVNKDEQMPITKQCDILSLSRSSVYYTATEKMTPEVINVMHAIDRVYTEYPFYGHRRICDELQEQGYPIGRDRTLAYMQQMGLEAFYPKRKRNTSLANKAHKVYPYLLRDLKITRANQVWATDITYIPLNGKFCYLVAIIDWYSRALLSYRISNSLDVQFCLEVLDDTLARYGKPEIFNSDQGCQFTSHAFTEKLLSKDIRISMDGKGRAIDNIIIERFFRTLKYEDIYLHRYGSIKELKQGLKRYMHFYNHKRRHSSLNKKTPVYTYYGQSISFN